MARIQGKTTTELPQHFAGVDVSKAYLDIRLSHERRAYRFTNDPAGFAALETHLGAASHLIVLEPTGRYHHAIWKALAAAGHQGRTGQSAACAALCRELGGAVQDRRSGRRGPGPYGG